MYLEWGHLLVFSDNLVIWLPSESLSKLGEELKGGGHIHHLMMRVLHPVDLAPGPCGAFPFRLLLGNG